MPRRRLSIPVSLPPKPSLDHERRLWLSGAGVVAGLDEAGRGPLAGPAVAGAVALPPFAAWAWLAAVRDSKLLTARRRERLELEIHRDALACAVGVVPTDTIDREGIVPATRQAMQEALAGLARGVDHLLIDALILPDVDTPQTALLHGDRICTSIACASILAKVARDAIMCRLDHAYPGYGLAQNKGYGTPAHLAALARLGPSPIHRRSFAPVRAVAPAGAR